MSEKLVDLTKAKLLIGRKLNGLYQKIDMKVGNSIYKIDNHKVDKDEKEKIKDEIEWENVRFILYRCAYTQDVRMDRINIKVEKDMTVSDVYLG